MAKAITVRRDDHIETHEAVVEHYRERLQGHKAEVQEFEYPPVYIGPTWQLDSNGFWLLPEITLGWDVIGWCGTWLQHGRDEPWRFTDEQARFILWWYALNEEGDFIYKDGVLQRLKGWGKDPVGACLGAAEMLGPCRFFEWWHGKEPLAADNPNAWVQTAAVSLEQTKNTMRLYPSLFSDAAKAKFDLQIGKEQLYALGGTRFLQAHTSSPSTMEGNRVTGVLMNETHHWKEANEGHEMAAVIRRNAAKAPDAGARSLRITNAYVPGEDTVAERDRDHFEKVRAGEAYDTGLLYDSIEAAANAPLTAEAAPKVIPSIVGDSRWLNVRSIVREILDSREPPSRARRFWYNQITASEESWVTPQQWDANQDNSLKLAEREQIVLFFDGSKSKDNTGCVGTRVSDGASFVLGLWRRPDELPDGVDWAVPRVEVDDRIRWIFATYDVVAFFADPGAGQDELEQRYWDKLIDDWGRDFGGDGADPERLCIWPVESGAGRHAVMWDMRNSHRTRLFTEAVERALSDILEGHFPHDGDLRLRMHVLNARRWPRAEGVSIGKEAQGSKKKIDLAVCAIGARMLRRLYLALPEDKKRMTDEPSMYETEKLEWL